MFDGEFDLPVNFFPHLIELGLGNGAAGEEELRESLNWVVGMPGGALVRWLIMTGIPARVAGTAICL